MRTQINDCDSITSMLKTLLNAITIISEMVFLAIMVKCDTSILIRDDRIYRYVGNPSQSAVFPDATNDNHDGTDTQKSIVTNHNSHSNSNSVSSPESIPESILIQLKDIKDASEFIANTLMRTPSKQNAKQNAIFLDYLQRGMSETEPKQEGKLEAYSGSIHWGPKLPKISKQAGCSTEMRIVELLPSNTGTELYFPSCVRIPRCSGCCPSQRLQCVPIGSSFEDFTVIHVNYSTTEQKFKFSGFKVFRIEKHDNCSCECKQKQSDCTNAQVFVNSECRCRCAETIEARKCRLDSNKFWDNDNCECKCLTVPLCSSGLVVNNNTCLCEKLEDDTSSLVWVYTLRNVSDHSLVYTLRNYSNPLPINYFKAESENKEIRTQHAKDSQWFNTKISPEANNNDYDSNGHI